MTTSTSSSSYGLIRTNSRQRADSRSSVVTRRLSVEHVESNSSVDLHPLQAAQSDSTTRVRYRHSIVNEQ